MPAFRPSVFRLHRGLAACLHPLLAAGVIVLTHVAGAAADVTVRIRDAAKQPVGDAVVTLTSVDGKTPPVAAGAPVEVVQKDQEFTPYVTVITAGTAVVFPNRDSVEHTIYSRTGPKHFQFPLYAIGKSESLTFDKPGVVVIGCDIHDWMLAYVVVVDTPWHVSTNDKGEGALTALTPGKYRLEVWHPQLKSRHVSEIYLADGPNAAEVAVTLAKHSPKRKRGPRGVGGGYN